MDCASKHKISESLKEYCNSDQIEKIDNKSYTKENPLLRVNLKNILTVLCFIFLTCVSTYSTNPHNFTSLQKSF